MAAEAWTPDAQTLAAFAKTRRAAAWAAALMTLFGGTVVIGLTVAATTGGAAFDLAADLPFAIVFVAAALTWGFTVVSLWRYGLRRLTLGADDGWCHVPHPDAFHWLGNAFYGAVAFVAVVILSTLLSDFL